MPAQALLLAISAVGAYDERLAVGDIWLNQATGCQTGLANWTCGLPCEKVSLTPPIHVTSDAKLETQAIMARRSATECTVAFRGSKNAMNVLEDLDFFPEAWGGCAGCKVHSGFLADWRSLRAGVRGALEELDCGRKGTTLSITGHSLGASMAALAAFELSGPGPSPGDRTYAVSRLYTYGQPRVGNVAFSSAFDARVASVDHWRVVDYRDAVPHLPTSDMLWEGWAHSGNEVYYNHTALCSYVSCTQREDVRCSYQWGLLETLSHTCDHCSYLGMNPCGCGEIKPQCDEVQGQAPPLVEE